MPGSQQRPPDDDALDALEQRLANTDLRNDKLASGLTNLREPHRVWLRSEKEAVLEEIRRLNAAVTDARTFIASVAELCREPSDAIDPYRLVKPLRDYANEESPGWHHAMDDDTGIFHEDCEHCQLHLVADKIEANAKAALATILQLAERKGE